MASPAISFDMYCSCAAAAAAPVRITTQHAVAFGQSIKVVGSGGALGEWDPAAAPGMTWAEGDEWSVEVEMEPGTYQFKLVVMGPDGAASYWEPGSNREFVVQEGSSGAISAACFWSETEGTVVSMGGAPTESSAPAGEAAQVEAAEAEAESEGAALEDVAPVPPVEEPTPTNQASEAPEDAASDIFVQDEAVAPVGEAQKDDAPNALEAVTEPEGETEEPAPALDEQTTTVPGSAKEWGPAGGGEMGSVDEADVEKAEEKERKEQWAENVSTAEQAATSEEEKQPVATPLADSSAAENGSGPAPGAENGANEDVEAPGVLEVSGAGGSTVEEAAASPVAAAQFEPDPSPEQVATGTLEVGSEPSAPAAQAVFKADTATDAAPKQAQEAPASQDAPAGLQVFVGLLGLAAVPVVAYSLYTLSTTGCGLPPGPNGALGLAEGLSYVTLLGIAAWSLGMKATTSRGLPAGPGGVLGAAEGLTYLSLAAGAVILTLQVKNYGYIPAALPDEKCFGEPQSPAQITQALANAFASAAKYGTDAASQLSSSLQRAAPDLAGAGPARFGAAAEAAAPSTAGGDAAGLRLEAGPQVEAGQQVDPPKQGNDALFKYLEK